ncbi:centromere protein O isoform X2 [Ambystoma mexicanum]
MAKKRALKQEEKKDEELTLAEMRETIQKLKNQRDELQAKVKLRDVGHLAQSMQECAKNISLAPTQLEQRRNHEILELKVANMKAMLQDFYLTGISGKKTARGVCICLSTAYESTYLDSYYVDLILRPRVRINHHSVPLFIPLKEIAKKYLTTNLKRFLFVLFDQLNAYAGRKFQADKLQENISDFGVRALQRNSLCNLLTFKYEVKWHDQSFRVSAKLLYGDSTRCLPTGVILSSQEGIPVPVSEILSAHSTLFREKAVHKVFEGFREGESLNPTAVSGAE